MQSRQSVASAINLAEVFTKYRIGHQVGDQNEATEKMHPFIWSVSSEICCLVKNGICEVATFIFIRLQSGVYSLIWLYPNKHPNKSPDKSPDKFSSNNMYINRLVKVVGYNVVTIKDALKILGLKDRESFMNVYLNPALKERFLRMKYPKSPRHPRQRYLLTVKGQMLYNELMKEH